MKLVGGVRIRQSRADSDSCQSRRFVKVNDVQRFQGCERLKLCTDLSKNEKQSNQTCLTEECEEDRTNCGLQICSCENGKYPICPYDRTDQGCFNEYFTDTGGYNWDWFSVQMWHWTGAGYFSSVSHGEEGEIFVPKFANATSVQMTSTPNRYILSKLNSTQYPAIADIGKTTGDYGTLGFYQDLPATNYSYAKEILNAMKQEMWFDVQTRTVGVTFQLYNTMSRYLTVVRFSFEIENTGRIFSRGEMFTFPLIWYGKSGSSNIRFGLEIAMCFFCLFFLQREVRKGVKQGLKYYCCRRKTTLVEVLTMGYVLMYFILYFNVNNEIYQGLCCSCVVCAVEYFFSFSFRFSVLRFFFSHNFFSLVFAFSLLFFLQLQKLFMF